VLIFHEYDIFDIFYYVTLFLSFSARALYYFKKYILEMYSRKKYRVIFELFKKDYILNINPVRRVNLINVNKYIQVILTELYINNIY